MRYRESKYGDALKDFQRSLTLATQSDDQARADLWIGKTEGQLGQNNIAQTTWQQSQSIDPGGYYSLRARDLLLGQDPFTSSSPTKLSFDLAVERKDADLWMRLTFNLPAGTDLTGPGSLALDTRFVRGTELWDLGQLEDARLEFEDLRNSINDDPVLTYRLANYLLDIGLYRSGIFAGAPSIDACWKERQSVLAGSPGLFQSRSLRLVLQRFDRPRCASQWSRPIVCIQRNSAGESLRKLCRLDTRSHWSDADYSQHGREHCFITRFANELRFG